MNVYDKAPKVDKDAFVAPSTSSYHSFALLNLYFSLNSLGSCISNDP